MNSIGTHIGIRTPHSSAPAATSTTDIHQTLGWFLVKNGMNPALNPAAPKKCINGCINGCIMVYITRFLEIWQSLWQTTIRLFSINEKLAKLRQVTTLEFWWKNLQVLFKVWKLLVKVGSLVAGSFAAGDVFFVSIPRFPCGRWVIGRHWRPNLKPQTVTRHPFCGASNLASHRWSYIHVHSMVA